MQLIDLGRWPWEVAIWLITGAATYLLGRRLSLPVIDQVGRLTQRRAEDLVVLYDRLFKKKTLKYCQNLIWGSCLGLALVFGLLAWRIGWGSLAVAVPAGMAGWFLPPLVIRFLVQRRLELFDHQLVDALTLMSNGLRSNLTLWQGIEMVSKEMPKPINQEFGLVLNEQAMGTRLEEALERMAARLPSEDLTLMVNAIQVLLESGGNLPEIFKTILFTITERKRVQGKIKALTAEGVMQGMVLAALPFVLGAVIYMINPEHMALMFTTVLGWVMIGFILALLAVGGLLMRSIIKIDI